MKQKSTFRGSLGVTPLPDESSNVSRGPLNDDGVPATNAQNYHALVDRCPDVGKLPFNLKNVVTPDKSLPLAGTFKRASAAPEKQMPAPTKASVQVQHRANQVRIEFSVPVKDIVMSAPEAHQFCETVRQHTVLAEAVEIARAMDRRKNR